MPERNASQPVPCHNPIEVLQARRERNSSETLRFTRRLLESTSCGNRPVRRASHLSQVKSTIYEARKLSVAKLLIRSALRQWGRTGRCPQLVVPARFLSCPASTKSYSRSFNALSKPAI